MLGSIIPKTKEVEFRLMKIPEMVPTEQTHQVACWAQMLGKHQKYKIMAVFRLSGHSFQDCRQHQPLQQCAGGERRSMGGSGASGLRQGLWGHTPELLHPSFICSLSGRLPSCVCLSLPIYNMHIVIALFILGGAIHIK